MDTIDPAPVEQLLDQFGISGDAESVWRVLIAEPDVERRNIRAQTGLTAAALDTALDALRDAQLVRSSDTNTGVIAIEPTLAVETHIVRAERKMAEQAERLATLRALLPSLASEFTHGRARAGNLPGFEVIESVDDIRHEVGLAAERVQHEIRALDHAPVGTYDQALEVQLGVLDRGVRDRTVIPPSALLDPETLAYHELIQRRGHETRTLPDVPTRIIIFDRDLAILPVDPSNVPLGAIVIRVQSVIDRLIFMYDHMWSIATPFFSGTSEPDMTSGRRARVLELLVAGVTDESTARTLGVANRTVRREVAELKGNLGVASRAEIAAAALRKGWL